MTVYFFRDRSRKKRFIYTLKVITSVRINRETQSARETFYARKFLRAEPFPSKHFHFGRPLSNLLYKQPTTLPPAKLFTRESFSLQRLFPPNFIHLKLYTRELFTFRVLGLYSVYIRSIISLYHVYIRSVLGLY